MKRILTLLIAVTVGLTSLMLTGCGSSKKVSADDMKADISMFQEELEALMNESDNESQMTDKLLDYCKDKGFNIKKVKGMNLVITFEAAEDAGNADSDTFLVEFRKDAVAGSSAAMATGLAALKNSVQHGNVTLILSPYSENDNIGVSRLDGDIISGDRVIDLTYTSEAVLMDGSAGSRNYAMTKNIPMNSPQGTLAYKISISGLPAANSGDRSEDHTNPIVFIGDILSDARADAQNIELASFVSSGDVFNYPTGATAVVVIDESIKNRFESRLEKALSRFEDKKGENEEAASFTYEVTDMPSQVYSYDDTANILSLIYTLIDGVFATSEPDYEGDILGLSSIYSVNTDDGVSVSVLGRYTDDATLNQMNTTFDTIAQLSGFTVTSEDMTGLWKNENNPILQDENFTGAFEKYHPEDGARYSFTSAVASELAEDFEGLSVISIGIEDGSEADTAMAITEYLTARCQTE